MPLYFCWKYILLLRVMINRLVPKSVNSSLVNQARWHTSLTATAGSGLLLARLYHYVLIVSLMAGSYPLKSYDRSFILGSAGRRSPQFHHNWLNSGVTLSASHECQSVCCSAAGRCLEICAPNFARCVPTRRHTLAGPSSLSYSPSTTTISSRT